MEKEGKRQGKKTAVGVTPLLPFEKSLYLCRIQDMFSKTKKDFENRTIADMSVFYSIVFVVSFTIATAFIGAIATFITKDLSDAATITILLAVYLPTIVFLVWLWLALVKIGRSWDKNTLKEKSGFFVFRILQIAFFTMVAINMLLSVEFFDDFSIVILILLVFDGFIFFAIILFLLMCWQIGYKISKRVYMEVAIMFLLFWVQLSIVLR
jgi:hypothetical protein